MTPDIDAIKDALAGAESLAELSRVRDQHRARVRALSKSDDPDLRVMAIQITNLALLREKQLTE